MRMLRNGLGLAVAVLVCLGAAGLGAMVTTPEIDGWYRTIAKPSWNPPDAIFGPVWTTLFLMMAIAAWLIWKRGVGRTIPLTLFGLQLLFNIAWSWIFFGLHQPGWAFLNIVALWLAIVATMVSFARQSRLAAWLLAPYLAWVSFAGLLNCVIWRMNVGG